MNIRSLSNEADLLKKISAISPILHKKLIQGIGDDAAVIKLDTNSFMLVTTDMLVENIHFKNSWSSPRQIGIKAVECNVSDIAAMGGKPTFIFTSLILPKNISITWLEQLYEGINSACNLYSIVLAGGDTTHGNIAAINITLIGTVDQENLCLRSHANQGDLLAVTGYLGNSAAGLIELSLGRSPSDYLLEKHTTPRCRLDIARNISPIVNAMIDISDGLSTEVHHICDSSKTGVKLYEADLPIHDEVKYIANRNNKKFSYFAITGGEDLELLFTIAPKHIKLLKKTRIPFYIIGKITEPEKGRIIIDRDGYTKPLPKKGYDHFI